MTQKLSQADTAALWHAVQWMALCLKQNEQFPSDTLATERERLRAAKRALRKVNAIRKAGRAAPPEQPSEAAILAIANQFGWCHLIPERYCREMGLQVGERWTVESVTPDQLIAFARAVLAGVAPAPHSVANPLTLSDNSA